VDRKAICGRSFGLPRRLRRDRRPTVANRSHRIDGSIAIGLEQPSMRSWCASTSIAMLMACGLRVTSPAFAGEINVDELVKQLEFLQDGTTERAEVIARLGPPQSTYANDLVAAYTVQLLAADRRLFVCPCPTSVNFAARFQLTLRFSADGVLQQHMLVQRDLKDM
jgi:hypothetical protein